ncbi:mitotic interactor and substrate of PLK1 [Dunckerocampus dactyliophorus]|uniref:mitotic interactor and substrate of PLK1 n=1 Tax=Dunckerocampus dactyliophorus TaxID=161453 RepID=UPI002404B06D|nr:mitotic interactor and substrate of PLK1 [Dunckerocampus dactyliophorus]
MSDAEEEEVLIETPACDDDDDDDDYWGHWWVQIDYVVCVQAFSSIQGVICSTPPPATMDNIPRRWVLKPLSPPLHPSDLRTMAGPSNGEDHFMATDSVTDSLQEHGGFRELVVQSHQVTVSQDGDDSSDDLCSGSPSSSLGSHCGFYSFVEDPTSPEAELNEAWMVSPQRQVHLTTLKEDKAFKVQTYNSGRKPEIMFSESESQYKLQPEDLCEVFGPEEEKQLRKDIIRKQAPKKKPTSKMSVLENLDRSRSTNSLTEGFSVSYSSSRLEPCRPAEPGTIISDQIDFSAARQQFMKLEQDVRNAPVHPGRPRVSWKVEEEDATRSEPSGEGETFEDWRKTENDSNGLNDEDFTKNDLLVEVHSGYISDEEVFDERIQSGSKGKYYLNNETPIEQEIRLVQEREENLRHLRRLKHSDGCSEMVEIRTKRMKSPLTSIEATEKKHVGFIVQQDNHNKNQKQEVSDLPQGFSATKEKPQDPAAFLSPCCPHRHAEETSSSRPPSWTKPYSWRDNQESTGLQCGKKGALEFIEKEIQDALRREQELRESRESRGSSESREPRERSLFSPAPLVEQVSRMFSNQFDLSKNSEDVSESCPTVSLVTSSHAPPPSKGLTGALLRDFEERRVRLKLDESSYAGIQPIDDINNQVVESTRVVRHKNQRALRWEAGVFANQLDH